MQQGHAIATAADLPKLVGYPQLRELYGWPRRTVQEWIKARKFPKPLNLPGRGNYWALDDIVAWMKGDMARVAVTRPDDLAPEQLAEAAVDLLTRAVEQEIGEPIDPRGLRVTYSAPSPVIVTEQQFIEAEASEAAFYQERFSGLDALQSYVIAAWLFPALRRMFADRGVNGAMLKTLNDPQRLRELAVSALSAVPGEWERERAKLNADEATAKQR